MSKYILLFVIALAIMVGCQADLVQPELEPEQVLSIDSTQGEAMSSETAVPSENAGIDENEPVATGSLDAGANDQPVSGVSSEPVVVDLSQITPQPVEDGAPVVMPAPGRPGPAAMTIPDQFAAFADEILDDLSQRLDLAKEQVMVTHWEEVIWSDGSLGCPEPGLMYTQALVEGYQITLWAEGKEYDYHTRGLAHFLLCGKNGPQIVPPADGS